MYGPSEAYWQHRPQGFSLRCLQSSMLLVDHSGIEPESRTSFNNLQRILYLYYIRQRSICQCISASLPDIFLWSQQTIVCLHSQRQWQLRFD
jgi:hypothetical protein